jgi:hypothetical protein
MKKSILWGKVSPDLKFPGPPQRAKSLRADRRIDEPGFCSLRGIEPEIEAEILVHQSVEVGGGGGGGG